MPLYFYKEIAHIYPTCEHHTKYDVVLLRRQTAIVTVTTYCFKVFRVIIIFMMHTMHMKCSRHCHCLWRVCCAEGPRVRETKLHNLSCDYMKHGSDFSGIWENVWMLPFAGWVSRNNDPRNNAKKISWVLFKFASSAQASIMSNIVWSTLQRKCEVWNDWMKCYCVMMMWCSLMLFVVGYLEMLYLVVVKIQ